MTLISKMKRLEKGEIIKVDLDPDRAVDFWFGCPNCGSVNTIDADAIKVVDGKVSTKRAYVLHCTWCSGCGKDFKVTNNAVKEV